MFISFIIYSSILLTIVIINYKRKPSEADFIVGGRSLNFWVTAVSAHASDMSSWLFIGLPVVIFTNGPEQAWIAVGLLLGMFFNWHFIAPKLRIMTEKTKSLTLSSFLETRFHDHTGFIRILTALICLIFFTFYISSGLQGAGFVFEVAFGITYEWGVICALAVALLYTVTGGFITVAWTDFFQGMFLLAVIIIVPIVAFQYAGTEVISNEALNKGIPLNIFPSNGSSGWLSIILFILAMGPGYFGQPHILTKFMGIKNADEIYKSKYFGITWQFFAISGAIFIGIVAIGFFKTTPNNPELIFILMTKAIFHPFLAGLMMCGILAATVSTIESQMLVQASLLSEDIYKKSIRPKAGSRELVWISRCFILIVGGISFIIAFYRIESVFELVMYSWAGLGASFGPIMLLSLHSKSVNRHGAIAAICVGATTVICWGKINTLFTIPIPALIPGFTLSLASGWLFSYLARTKFPPYSKT